MHDILGLALRAERKGSGVSRKGRQKLFLEGAGCGWPWFITGKGHRCSNGERRGIRKKSYLFTWKPHFLTVPQTESLHSSTLGMSPQGFTLSSQTVHKWKLSFQMLSRLRKGDTNRMGTLVSQGDVPILDFWHVIITCWEDKGGMGDKPLKFPLETLRVCVIPYAFEHLRAPGVPQMTSW